MPSPIVPLVVGLGGLAALGIHLSKKREAAPALGPAPSAPMPVAAPTMAAPEPAPEPPPEPAPAPSSDGGGGGGGGGASAPSASDPGPTSGGAAATAAASAAQAPTVSSMASRFTLPKGPAAPTYSVPTMADRQALAANLPKLSLLTPRVYAAPTAVRRVVPHGDISGDFGGDVQTFAKDNAPTMLLAAGSGGIIGWLFAKSIGGAVLGAALAPVAVAFAATKLIDKAVS